MNLTDIRDQIKDQLMGLWSQTQESPVYQRMMEKYEDLSPNWQRGFRTLGIVIPVLFLVSHPISIILESKDSIEKYQNKRDTTRDLLRVVRDSANAPNIPQAPDLYFMKDQMQQTFQLTDKLLPEQIESILSSVDSGSILPQPLTLGSLSVSLLNLNLRQITTIGYRMATISSSVKMTDLEITASPDRPGYFHMTSKVVALKAPEPPKFEPEEPIKRNNAKKRPNPAGNEEE